MAEFTVSEVCSATNGQISNNTDCRQFTGVCTDTRRIKPGNLFVALAGERFDGHEFVEQAITQGAAGILVQRAAVVSSSTAAIITVADTRQALQNLATFHRRRFDVPVIAITGSNGKTTTKDLTAAVLASRFSVLKTEANFNNEIGLPLTLLNLTCDHQAAVVEMGMRGLGEIAELARIAEPTAGIVTNVGETHMELLGSLDNIALAKSELVTAIPTCGFIMLNGDDPYVQAMNSKANGKVIFYGLQADCHVRATDIVVTDQQTAFVCHCHGRKFPVLLPAIGRHNVYNALAAIGAGWELGLTADEITAGILTFQAGTMRQQIQCIGSYTVINDAYNASPLSMASALDTLRQVARGRMVAVLGDMLELGNVAVDAHRRIGKLAAEQGVQLVITVGSLAKNIAEAARESGVDHVAACDNHQQAVQALHTYLQPGDTVLIKGSRGMKMEQLVNMLGQ